MSKHTEGPWEAHYLNAVDRRYWFVRSPDSAVADIRGSDNATANAIFIATAPEMVELLCEVLFSQTLAEDLEDRIEKCVAQALGPENMPKQRKT